MKSKAIFIFIVVSSIVMILLYHFLLGDALDLSLIIRALITFTTVVLIIKFLEKRKSKKE